MSVITCSFSILFIPTFLFGIFLFFKINIKTLVKVLIGIQAAILILLFTNNILLENELHIDFSTFYEFQVSSTDKQSILILLIISVLFFYYMFNNFSNNLKTRMYNLFMIIYFLNSLVLALISRELFVFLFFPFLISFSNIISNLKHKLIFEISLILVIFVLYNL